MHKERIHEMIEKLTEMAHVELNAKGNKVNTQEMGEVVDMIKDLCEAEMLCEKKCYYESIVEAMEEEKEYEGRMGYDRWRTSKGRFAEKGHGHETSMAKATGRHGFTPDDKWPNPPYYDDPRLWTEPWISAAGYDRDHPRPNDGRTSGSSYEHTHAAGRMGYTPDGLREHEKDKRTKYHDARRHYQETGSQEHKMKMDETAGEYLMESIDTMRDIFTQADPRMQQKMKDDLFRLYREMGGK